MKFQHQEIQSCNSHINQLKENNQMMTSLDAEKTLDRIQYAFLILKEAINKL